MLFGGRADYPSNRGRRCCLGDELITLATEAVDVVCGTSLDHLSSQTVDFIIGRRHAVALR